MTLFLEIIMYSPTRQQIYDIQTKLKWKNFVDTIWHLTDVIRNQQQHKTVLPFGYLCTTTSQLLQGKTGTDLIT